MTFQDKHGKYDDRLLREAEKRGQPLPEFIQNEPVLECGEDFYLTAFMELSTCRSYAGMAGLPLSIPFTAVSAYCDELDIHGEERVRFRSIITHVDNWYINRKQDNEPSRTSDTPTKDKERPKHR